MLSSLPKGSDFRLSGSRGFNRILNRIAKNSSFPGLKGHESEIQKIFKSLKPTIKRNGKIPSSTRIKASRQFSSLPGTSRLAVKSFKKILNYYK
jgi:hypothetical protein